LKDFRDNSMTADLQDLSDRMSRCEGSLLDVCAGVEPNFLKLGEDLQRIYTEASDLTRQTMDAVCGAGENKDGEMFNRVVGVARDALKKLNTDRQRTGDGLKMLGDIIEALTRLKDISTKLNAIAKTLKMIGFSIGVESVRSQGDQEVFAALAREIKGLGDTVRARFHSIHEDVDQIQTHLVKFYQEMSGDIHCLKALFEDAEKALGEAVPSVERVLETSDRIFRQTGRMSKEISDLVGGVVVGIQIHDNTRQRIEHIAAAVKEAEDLCRQTAAQGPGDDAEGTGVAYSVLSLQETQLLQVVGEVEAVQQNSSRAFGELQRVVDRISNTLSALTDGQIKDDPRIHGEKNAVEDLKSILDNINSFLNQGAARMSYLGSTVDAAAASIAKLATHMDCLRDINLDIHLKAINAIANSLRLGRSGAAIRVIVNEMKDLAKQSNALVADIDQIIRSIGADTETITSLMGTDTGDADGTAGFVHLDVALNEFDEACTAHRENAHSIFLNGSALGNEISIVGAELAFFTAFSGELKQYAAALQEIRTALKPSLKESEATYLHRAGKITERYTMQEERGIHAAFVDGSQDTDPCESPYDAGVENVTGCRMNESEEIFAGEKTGDELGDNVELF
jgi:methyl-accepting chemotaxis protein